MGATAGNLCIPHRYTASIDVVRNLATLVASAEPTDLPSAVLTAVIEVVSYSFSPPGDAYLIALWPDGVAVDDDAGIPATLCLAAQYADYTVVPVGPLHGLQQEILSEVEAEGLAAPKFVIKDYPLILRLYVPKDVFLPTILAEAAP
jgi:hypothetical protein